MKWRAYKKDRNRTNYTCRGPDHNGVERTVPGYPDKDLSKDLAAKIHQLVCHKANSSAPPPWLREWGDQPAAENPQPLAEIGLHDASVLALPLHVDAFESHLRTRGGTARHVKETIACLNRVLKGSGIRRLTDLKPGMLSAWIEQRRAKVGPITINSDIQTLKSFSRFCVRDGRLPADPLVGVQQIDPKGDLKHRRRALSDEELGKFLATTRVNTRDSFGLTARTAIFFI